MILDFGYVCSGLEMALSPGGRDAADAVFFGPSGRGAVQAIAASRMGGNVVLIGAVGQDIFGQEVVHRLQREGIAASGLARVEAPTGVSLRLHTGEGQAPRTIVYAGANHRASAAQVPILSLNARTVVLLQDDHKPEENLKVATLARERGAQVLYDCTRGEDVRSYTDLGAILVTDNAQSAPQTAAMILCRADGFTLRLGSETYDFAYPALDQGFDDALARDALCGAMAVGLQTGVGAQEALRRAGWAAYLAGAAPKIPGQIPLSYYADVMAALHRHAA